jgi:outer membrane protein assembly factor BamB
VFRTEQDAIVGTALAVSGGRVYEVDSGQLHVYDAAGTTNCAVSPALCTPLWTASATGSPAVSDGHVYVGADAFDAAGCGQPSCARLWTAAVPPATVSHAAPAVAGGLVYLGSSDSSLYAFPAAGCGAPTCAPAWSAPTGGVVRTPSVANGVVYVGSDDGKLRAFDAASGCGPRKCARWKAVLGAPVVGSPALSSAGRVYVATSDRGLHAFGLPTAPPG